MNPKSWILIAFFVASISSELCFCREFGIVRLKKLTQPSQFSSEIDTIARFAIKEHNRRANALLKLGKVLKVKEQVVAGKIYYLTLEAIDAGKKSIYDAKVWVKPWINFKQLEEFKPAVDVPHSIVSELRIMREKLGWHKVPIHDPDVQGAANFAITIIQKMSNSLFPCQLSEILQAEAEVVKDFIKYNLLLKLKFGTMEEKIKVQVRKNVTGNFHFSMMEHPDM